LLADDQLTFERLLSPEFDRAPREPINKYLICSSPRTGSTLLSAAFRQSGVAGYPTEYLHADAISTFRRRFPDRRLSVWDYLDFLESTRQTANGVFGFKAHFEHVVAQFSEDDERTKFLRRFDRIILVSRRDVLAQAISLYRANSTRVWNVGGAAEQQDALAKAVEFNPDEMYHYLVKVLEQEEGWNQLLRSVDVPIHELEFETITSRYRDTLASCALFLDIRELVEKVDDGPLLRQLSDHQNVAWARQYLRYLLESAAS
jgi:LPS sulfotransferase NodH